MSTAILPFITTVWFNFLKIILSITIILPQSKELRTDTQTGPSGCPGNFRNFPEPP